MFLCQKNNIWFFLDPCLSRLRFLDTPAMSSMGFISWNGALIQPGCLVGSLKTVFICMSWMANDTKCCSPICWLFKCLIYFIFYHLTVSSFIGVLFIFSPSSFYTPPPVETFFLASTPIFMSVSVWCVQNSLIRIYCRGICGAKNQWLYNFSQIH